MSERIFTLFGEEIVPEPVKPAGKSRAKKTPKEQKEETEAQTNEALQLTDEPAIAATKENAPKTMEHTTPEVGLANEAPAETTATTNKKTPKTKEHTTAETSPVNETPQLTKDAEGTNTVATKKKAEHVNLPDEWDGDKQYYSIGEVAALFSVKTSHIRFWTNEFKLKVRTTRKGDRLFTPEQIKELRAIHHLVKERGFTLAGAKAKLKTQNKRDVETIDLKQSLTQLRDKLVAIKNQLK